MRSVVMTFRLCAVHLRKEFSNPKIYIVAILSLLLVLALVQPVVDFARVYDEQVTPYAAVFIFSDFFGTFTSMLMILGMVAICAECPSKDTLTMYSLIRSGRRIWLGSQILYIAIISMCYVFYWLAISLIPLLGNIEWSGDWGRVWNTLAYTTAGDAINLKLDVPSSLISNYTALEALIYSITLKCVVCCFVGLVVVTGNLLMGPGAGVYIGILVALEDIFAYNGGYGYWFTWLSPATMSRLTVLDNSRTFLFPSVSEALAVLLCLSICMVCLAVVRGSKKVYM